METINFFVSVSAQRGGQPDQMIELEMVNGVSAFHGSVMVHAVIHYGLGKPN